MRTTIVCSIPLLALAGCVSLQEDTSGNTLRHLFEHPPQRAGACFARNAEAHSSALVAEVSPPDGRGHVTVIVRVRNGVTYATAELRPAAQGASGTIDLMAISLRGRRELLRSLVEGC